MRAWYAIVLTSVYVYVCVCIAYKYLRNNTLVLAVLYYICGDIPAHSNDNHAHAQCIA